MPTKQRPTVILPPAPDYALVLKHKFYSGWSQRYFIQSDVHWDSPECYFKLYQKHLREAKESDALILDNGDFNDVIGSMGDKRGNSRSAVIPEHADYDYLDRIVNDGAEQFAEYADNWVLAGRGNHDWFIASKRETDILRRWVDAMNRKRSAKLPPIHVGGYTNWVRFMFESDHNIRCSHAMKMEHGVGGNAPVTKGVIQANRRQVRTHGATFYVSGHIHEAWNMPYLVETLNLSSSRIEQRLCQHIQVASYKMDFRPDGLPTWIMQKAGDPKPIGGVWLEFWSHNGREIGWTITPAVAASDYPRLSEYLRSPAKISRHDVA